MLTEISQKTLPDLPELETIVLDTDVDQGSDTETINYFEDDYIGKIIPEMLDGQQQTPQELLDSLTKIGSTPSPPPQGDELLTEISLVNERETITINDDFNISRTTNGKEITNNNDDNSKVSFVKQTPQYPKQRSARMLRNKALTIEINADVLENYPSFTADINIDETDKNIKQREVFDRIINQLPPDNDTAYIGNDRKNNKFRVRRETSDKNATQKSYEKR